MISISKNKKKIGPGELMTEFGYDILSEAFIADRYEKYLLKRGISFLYPVIAREVS